MASLNIYINNKEPNNYKITTVNFKDNEIFHSYTDYHNEDEVLNKVKDFLSKNKIKDKPYTGDILFVFEAPNYFTPNKIYHIKDGIIKDDNGCSFPYYENMPFTSFEDVKEYFSAEGRKNYPNSRYSSKTCTLIEVAP